MRAVLMLALCACTTRAAITAADATAATARGYRSAEAAPEPREIYPDTAMPPAPEPKRVAAANPDAFRGPNADDRSRARDVALALMKIAAHDARSARCPDVIRAGDHVQRIDRDVYERVFVVDPAIASCLDARP